MGKKGLIDTKQAPSVLCLTYGWDGGDDGRMATKRLKTNGTTYSEAVVKQLEGLMVVLEQNIETQALEIEELAVEVEALSASLEEHVSTKTYSPHTLWGVGGSYQPPLYGSLYAPPVLPSWYKRMLKKIGL